VDRICGMRYGIIIHIEFNCRMSGLLGYVHGGVLMEDAWQ
jgi:hypothetical protein